MTSSANLHDPKSENGEPGTERPLDLDAIPAPEPARPIRWRAAWRGFRALVADPERTELAFSFFDTLGGSDEILFQRSLATAAGRRLLAERSSLVHALADREALAALPENSFGRAYLAFAQQNGFAADGLLQAREEAGSSELEASDPYREWFFERLTVMHDLWHVLTGYGTDQAGEAHLLAFSLAHMPIRSIRVVSLLLLLRAPRQNRFFFHRGLLAARRRGRRSAPLISARFEELLARPLEAVRNELGIAPLAETHPEGLVMGSQEHWSIRPVAALPGTAR